MNLILASSSPRRSELLRKASIEFEVIPSSIDETFDPSLTPAENARLIAEEKAKPVAVKFPDRLTLAADTFVVLDGKVLLKPLDEKDAIKMLRSLSGREHSVLTGFALVCHDRDIFFSETVESKVKFKNVAPKDMEDYVAGGEPMDKAGSYAIQGGAKDWIESYSGSLSNIIGLPMEAVSDALVKCGYELDERKPSTCR